MAYRIPVFNLWSQVWRLTVPGVPGDYTMAGYSRCQLRGPDSHLDGGGNLFEILFPKWSDVRGRAFAASFGDVIIVAGWDEQFWATVFDVSDKGAGFANEYRQAICSWRGITASSPEGPFPTTNPLLDPPVGYLALPLTPPFNDWPSAPPF